VPKTTCLTSPFKITGFHSDNGSELINRDAVNWRETAKTLGLSRSRSWHKNDNCFAGQKNNAFVRNYVGYWRYDTREERDTLNRVYRFLCPQVNFFIPDRNLVSRSGAGSKIARVYDKALKTPYRRLVESSLTEEEKAGLPVRRALLNPVELQYNLNQAADKLLAARKAKVTFPKCPT
jgi:hypothetical protein